MKVLIIPENPRLDEHILRPIVKRLFDELKRKVRVEVLKDPHLGGVSEALDSGVIDAVLAKHRWQFDLFLLIVDRDCDECRHTRLEAREQQAAELGDTLIGCLAFEEVEVWALALHRDKLSDRWSVIREHCNPKEAYFEPLVKQQGWLEAVGRGRVPAMRALSSGIPWAGLCRQCDELDGLQQRLAEWLDARDRR